MELKKLNPINEEKKKLKLMFNYINSVKINANVKVSILKIISEAVKEIDMIEKKQMGQTLGIKEQIRIYLNELEKKDFERR